MWRSICKWFYDPSEEHQFSLPNYPRIRELCNGVEMPKESSSEKMAKLTAITKSINLMTPDDMARILTLIGSVSVMSKSVDASVILHAILSEFSPTRESL